MSCVSRMYNYIIFNVMQGKEQRSMCSIKGKRQFRSEKLSHTGKKKVAVRVNELCSTTTFSITNKHFLCRVVNYNLYFIFLWLNNRLNLDVIVERGNWF